jgi:hypothetical protein
MDRRNWNQVDLGEGMEASQATVSRWLNDSRGMSKSAVRRFREIETEDIAHPTMTCVDVCELFDAPAGCRDSVDRGSDQRVS